MLEMTVLVQDWMRMHWTDIRAAIICVLIELPSLDTMHHSMLLIVFQHLLIVITLLILDHYFT